MEMTSFTEQSWLKISSYGWQQKCFFSFFSGGNKLPQCNQWIQSGDFFFLIAFKKKICSVLPNKRSNLPRIFWAGLRNSTILEPWVNKAEDILMVIIKLAHFVHQFMMEMYLCKEKSTIRLKDRLVGFLSFPLSLKSKYLAFFLKKLNSWFVYWEEYKKWEALLQERGSLSLDEFCSVFCD